MRSRGPVREPAVIFLIFLAGLIQAAWFTANNFHNPTLVDDLFEVSGYLSGFSHSLREGNPYPRWLSALFSGAGAPIFVYYPPVAFYIGSLFTLPASLDPNGYLTLGLAMGAAISCASLTAYIWLKRHISFSAAGMISLALALMPSQFTAMHMRISLAQLWAEVWFPLGLICIEQWHAKRRPRNWAALAFILSLILLTHMPSALLFWPVLLAYGCTSGRGAFRAMAKSALLALALCAVYLLPLLLNKNAIRSDGYLNAIPDYRAVFLPPPDLLLFFVPKIFIEALPFFLMAAAALWIARKSRIKLLAASLLLSSVLFLPISIPLWQHMSVLQASFRLLALYFVLSPLLLLSLKRQMKSGSFLILLGIAFFPGWWLAAEDYALRREISLNSQSQHIIEMNEGAGSTAPEYKTAWMPTQTSPGYFISVYGPLPQASITQGIVAVTSWRNEAILLHVTAPAAATLHLKEHYFPGWQAQAGDKAITPVFDDKGLMQMELPAGDYEVSVRFSGLKGTKTGSIISLLSLALVIVLWTRRGPGVQTHRT